MRARASIVSTAVLAVAILGCGGGGAERERSGWAFVSERPPTVLADPQSLISAFELGSAGVIQCQTATYGARLRKPSEFLGMHVRYRGCSLGGAKVSIRTDGCVFLGRLEIGDQTPAGVTAFSNTGKEADRTFDASAELRGIAADASGNGCPETDDERGISLGFGIELWGSEHRGGGKGRSAGVWLERRAVL